MKMPKWSSVLPIALIVLLIIIIACMFLSGAIGEKTIVGETIVLPHDGQKTYNVPPGFVTIKVDSRTPIDEIYQGIGVSGEGHGIAGGSVGLGSIFGARYTVINPGNMEAGVNIRITTGALNPFGYI